MRWRGIFVLAILAALMGAPPTASAASNALHSPEASPTAGTIDTVFILRVGYDGRFPADGVAATVAGLALPMALVAGSATQGTWQVAAAALPAGTWPVAFAAKTSQGNVPTLDGPTLSVGVPDAPATSSPATIAPHGPKPHPGRDGIDHPTTPPEATAAPAPAEPGPTTPSAPAGGKASEPTPLATAEPDAAPDDPGTASDPSPTTAAGADGPEASSGTPGVGSGERAPGTVAAPARPDERRSGTAISIDDPLLVALVRGVAIWGAALLGLAVAGLVLLAVRRRRQTAPGDTATMAAADTTALLERRATRRAKVVLDEDPIVASMGIDDRPVRKRRRADRRRDERGRSG